MYLYLLTGIRGETVTGIAQRLLAHHGGPQGLLRLDGAKLAQMQGIGNAKGVRLLLRAGLRSRQSTRPMHQAGGTHPYTSSQRPLPVSYIFFSCGGISS